MPLTLSYFCGLAAIVFINTGVMAAAVRWFHMCQPYDRNPRYYYPGRPYVVSIYLSFLIVLPYVLQPDCPDAWFLVRLYFLPATLYQFTILLFAYFGTIMQWKRWRVPIFVIGFPVVAALVVALVLTLIPGTQSGRLSDVVLYVLGAVVTGVCLTAIWVVLNWAGQFDEDDFSNSADYPVRFARRGVTMILVDMALCWAGALAGSRALMAVVMLLLSASSMVFIIAALRPHRYRQVEAEEPATESDTSTVYNRAIPDKKREEILQAIRIVVEEQEGFLDPHLTLQDVADRSGYNRSYISGLIKAEWGGFFAYVNRLRLAHVEAWLKEHPAGMLKEALEESGFNSRQTYYSVKDRLGKKG